MKIGKISHANILEELAFCISKKLRPTLEVCYSLQLNNKKPKTYRSHSLVRNYWNLWYSCSVAEDNGAGVYGAGTLRMLNTGGTDSGGQNVYAPWTTSLGAGAGIYLGSSNTAWSFEDIWLASYIGTGTLAQLTQRDLVRMYDAGAKTFTFEMAKTFYNISGGDVNIWEIVSRPTLYYYLASAQTFNTTFSRDVFPAVFTLPDLNQVTAKVFYEWTLP